MGKKAVSKPNTVKTRCEVNEAFRDWGMFQGTFVHYICTGEETSFIYSFLNNCELVPFERPDAYIKRDNQVLIIEHFSIDGYDVYPNGGSRLSEKKSKINKAISKMFYDNPEGSLTTRLGAANSYDRFIQNCIDRFTSHYSNINEYKQRLIEKGIANRDTLFTVCFLMEDTSPLGTLVNDGETTMPVCLAHSKEFLNFYKNMPDVDYILSNAMDLKLGRYVPYVFSNKSAESLLTVTIDYKSMQFLSSNPLFIHRGFSAECREYALGDLLSYVQPTPYIVNSTDYCDSYKTPVLTAGKSFVLGYTNETEGIFHDLPVIIFDDFTTASKYVDFPFKVKSSAMKILIPDTTKVLPKYIYYRMQTISFDSSTHKRYWIQQYSIIKVQIPPLPMQERIVARIEEKLSQLDAGVETLKKTKAQLAVYRQAVLKEAFSTCTEKRAIRALSSIVTSGSRGWASFYSDAGARFIRITDLTRSGIELKNDNIQHVLLPDKAEGKRSRLHGGDVLVSITADLGSIALIPDSIEEAYINQHIAIIRFNNPEQGEFMAWYLRSEWGQKDLLKNKRGGGKLGLGLDDIRDTPVPVVSNEYAINTVSFIDSRLSICNSIEQTVDTALQQAEAMRQSILKNAFEGRLI